MALVYRFKKERLANGSYASRPRILVELGGSNSSIVIAALIDTGCDVTVVPEGIAKAIGLDMSGTKDKLYGYREATNAIRSSAALTFLGKEHRQSVTLSNIPVLIALATAGIKEEEDITLGVEGVFDAFDITFKKVENKIIFKRTGQKVLF
ncbi:hypothetical protein HYU20_03735 [Candidatus Woesearchaeota archaeon]|nr:hypothetical protein [Candidatus Woesearchaeota archaeon]